MNLAHGARGAGAARHRAEPHVGITAGVDARATRPATAKPIAPPHGATTASSTAGTGSRRCAARTRPTSSSAWDRWRRGSRPAISQRVSPPIDFFGHNSYTRAVVRDDPDLGADRRTPGPQTDKPKTAMGWEIYPDHLYDALTRITRDYGAPDIYITENGAAFDDDGRQRRRRRSAAHRLPAHASRRLPSRHRSDGVDAARLLLLVAARQLRVVVRLLEALRHRLRRLRDAAAHREGERALLRRGGAAQRPRA